ncbi:hypothetical protein G6011_05713 [Alternaria panax]|uniref:Heterokaryon incompatibility domain-containing protein n=1 Tax=Alternaria panax TaxID=48097 RepID=A0AAD4I6X9_9PLEO|nr:hypothetical protein G6011_05713 [Alternaria panax]
MYGSMHVAFFRQILSDFKHQIRQMHLVYRSAQITTIAAGDMDTESGLVGISTPRANVQTKGRYDKLNLTTFSYSPWASIRYVDEWAKRGWTLQEGYFSPRRLVSTDNQVLFDCNEGVMTEDLRCSQIQYRAMLQKWQPTVQGEAIYLLMERYTGRVLTYDSNIPNAFNGILGDSEQQEPPARSHWGIPSILDASGYLNGLLIGLCWCHPVQNENINRRPGFPSWSWAGWIHMSILISSATKK